VRIAIRLLLLVALAASSLTLTQCRMVGDRLTGIGVDQLRRKDDCVRACKDTYKAALKAEKDFHKTQVTACAGDPACLAAENARYAAAVQAIEAAYTACINGCHSQGGGAVGP
jgi:hypothetical protein